MEIITIFYVLKIAAINISVHAFYNTTFVTMHSSAAIANYAILHCANIYINLLHKVNIIFLLIKVHELKEIIMKIGFIRAMGLNLKSVL